MAKQHYGVSVTAAIITITEQRSFIRKSEQMSGGPPSMAAHPFALLLSMA